MRERTASLLACLAEEDCCDRDCLQVAIGAVEALPTPRLIPDGGDPMPDAPGVARGEGESIEEAADRLREDAWTDGAGLLTEQERDVVAAAERVGYYEGTREGTVVDILDEVDSPRSDVEIMQRLRSAHGKLVRAHLEGSQ